MGRVRLEKMGRKIKISSDGALPGLVKEIPGAYASVRGYYTAPLSLEICKLLQAKYPGRLSVSTELQRWAIAVKNNRAYMGELAAASSAELEVVPRVAPKLYEAMKSRPYQLVGARFIADTHATLLADDPGLGKTLETMAGILEAETPGPYLIVAPKTAADSVWRREIERWLPREHRVLTVESSRDKRERALRLFRYGPTSWVVVHPEMVMTQAWWVCAECGQHTVQGPNQQTMLDCGHERNGKRDKAFIRHDYPKLFEVEWGAIIVDESHESLIRRKGVKTQRRRGLDMLPLRQDGIRIASSGTPFESKPHQLWGTLNWLDSKTYAAFYRWAEMFWEKGGFTGYEIGAFREDREQLLWDSLSAIALRRTKAEVASDLPPKTYVGSPFDPFEDGSPEGIWLPMESKQERAYRSMEAASVAQLDSGRLDAVTALAELTRLKQLACSYGDIESKMVRVTCASEGKSPKYYCDDCRRRGYHMVQKLLYRPTLPSNKFNWTVEALEEWGYPTRPRTGVVIVSFYTGILEAFQHGIEKHFRTKHGNRLCTAITGKTRQADREPIIRRYNQAAGPRIMLLNVKAGGTAITLDTADHMIFISETRIPDQQKQAEDRIHRVSNPRHVMYYYLRSLDTVDVGTAYMNQEADAVSHRLLDGRRGVEYVRHVLARSH